MRNTVNTVSIYHMTVSTVTLVRYCKKRNFKIFHNVIVRDNYEIDDYLHGKEIKE